MSLDIKRKWKCLTGKIQKVDRKCNYMDECLGQWLKSCFTFHFPAPVQLPTNLYPESNQAFPTTQWETQTEL